MLTTAIAADPVTVRVHKKRLYMMPTDHLHEELRVIDSAEAMADLDGETDDDIVRNSAIEFASQRQAVREILEYRERRGVDVPSPTYGIPREVIDEIKARRPIEDEVELFTDLRKSGKSCRGVCPLCPGKSNPTALAVSTERQTWHCFSCDVGGDVIAWQTAVHREWDFLNAVSYLSGVTGVEIPSRRDRAPRVVARGTVNV